MLIGFHANVQGVKYSGASHMYCSLMFTCIAVCSIRNNVYNVCVCVTAIQSHFRFFNVLLDTGAPYKASIPSFTQETTRRIQIG